MKTKNYIPQPIDTTAIELPNELMNLAEEMAKNVHEVWSAGRVAELPESEKEYDRRTSVETLKFIIARGFEIVKR